jgi:hypothetical protein
MMGKMVEDSSEDLDQDQNNNNNNPIRTSGGRNPPVTPSVLRNIKLQATHGVKGISF